MDNYKGIYFNAPSELKSFEGGAHFRYRDLYSKLEKLQKELNQFTEEEEISIELTPEKTAEIREELQQTRNFGFDLEEFNTNKVSEIIPQKIENLPKELAQTFEHNETKKIIHEISSTKSKDILIEENFGASEKTTVCKKKDQDLIKNKKKSFSNPKLSNPKKSLNSHSQHSMKSRNQIMLISNIIKVGNNTKNESVSKSKSKSKGTIHNLTASTTKPKNVKKIDNSCSRPKSISLTKNRDQKKKPTPKKISKITNLRSNNLRRVVGGKLVKKPRVESNSKLGNNSILTNNHSSLIYYGQKSTHQKSKSISVSVNNTNCNANKSKKNIGSIERPKRREDPIKAKVQYNNSVSNNNKIIFKPKINISFVNNINAVFSPSHSKVNNTTESIKSRNINNQSVGAFIRLNTSASRNNAINEKMFQTTSSGFGKMTSSSKITNTISIGGSEAKQKKQRAFGKNIFCGFYGLYQQKINNPRNFKSKNILTKFSFDFDNFLVQKKERAKSKITKKK